MNSEITGVGPAVIYPGGQRGGWSKEEVWEEEHGQLGAQKWKD